MPRQHWKWKALGARVGDILGAVDLGELEHALPNRVAEQVQPRVDVTTPGRVDLVVRHIRVTSSLLIAGEHLYWYTAR
eukprot:232833-Rhodomonas_salina.1